MDAGLPEYEAGVQPVDRDIRSHNNVRKIR